MAVVTENTDPLYQSVTITLSLELVQLSKKLLPVCNRSFRAGDWRFRCRLASLRTQLGGA